MPSKARRLSLDSMKAVDGCGFMRTVPSEIVDKIVRFMLADSDYNFLSVASLSLVCYRFRQIAFRRYFAVLHASSKYEWYSRCKIPGIFSWTRVLQCNSNALYLCPETLQQFRNLDSVIISFHTEGRNIAHTSTRLILKSIPLTVTSLTLERLPFIDSYLIQLVAASLPDLRYLQLSCAERLSSDLCCWGCYQEAGSWTVHSPIPVYFCDTYDLVNTLGEALRPLCKLVDLFLGIYLSDEDVFYEHIDLCGKLDVYEKPFSPGECAECQHLYGKDVRTLELLASKAIARRLPLLNKISWSTFFNGDTVTAETGSTEKTAFEIKRQDGEVVLKRVRP